MPNAEDWERFLKILQKKGKSRIRLSAKIFQEDHLSVEFFGHYYEKEFKSSKSFSNTNFAKTNR